MIHLHCAHCETPLPDGARLCDRCGAPVTGALGGNATPAPEGFTPYVDSWRGLRLHHPVGWRVAYPIPGAIAFRHPEGQASVELGTLPAHQVADATQLAKLWLRGLGEHEARVAPGARTERATVLFRAAGWHGHIEVHLGSQGGRLAIARRRPDARVDIDDLAARVFGSLAATRSMPREPFRGAPEGAFHLLTPPGWQVHAGIQPQGHMRIPMCRVIGDPSGAVFYARELETHHFVDRPVEQPETAKDEGIFATLGRWARKLDDAVATSMGSPPMPFAGLRPVTERYFLPRWQQAIPGLELLHFDDHDLPHLADVRVRHPNGIIQVIRLEGARVPDPMGVARWVACAVHTYQAPDEVMDRYEPVLSGIAESFRLDPGWQQRDHQRFQQALAQQQQQQQQMLRMQQMHHQQRMASARQASNAIYETGQAISDMQMSSWEARSESFDRMNHDMTNTIFERTEYVDPMAADPTVYNVSSDFDRVFTDHQGNFFGADWSFHAPPAWTELDKLK